MATEEKALDKIDIKSELKTLSPIEQKSIELKQRADEIEIVDKPTYQEAKRLKRELTSHRTATKELRLTFTRKLDNLKDQFIKKQDAVLEPSIAGEEAVKQKIADWEKAERERKEEEEKRIEAICQGLTDVLVGLKRKESTLEDVKRARASLKMERGLLEVNDRNKKVIKDTVSDINEKLNDIGQFITDRIEQERIAEEQRKERQELETARVKLHSEQLEAIGFPLNDTVFGFRISGLDLTKSDEEWQPLLEQAKKRLQMAADAKAKEAPAKESEKTPVTTTVTEPAKESSEAAKTSEGSNTASQPSESLEPAEKSELDDSSLNVIKLLEIAQESMVLASEAMESHSDNEVLEHAVELRGAAELIDTWIEGIKNLGGDS